MSSGEDFEDFGAIISADEVNESSAPAEKKMKLKMGAPLLKSAKVGGKTPKQRPQKRPTSMNMLLDKEKKFEYFKQKGIGRGLYCIKGTIRGVYTGATDDKYYKKIVVQPEQYGKINRNNEAEGVKDIHDFVPLVFASLEETGVSNREEIGNYYSQAFSIVCQKSQKVSCNGIDIDIKDISLNNNGRSVFCTFELDYLKVLSSTRKGYLNFIPKGRILIKEEDKVEDYAAQMGF